MWWVVCAKVLSPTFAKQLAGKTWEETEDDVGVKLLDQEGEVKDGIIERVENPVLDALLVISNSGAPARPWVSSKVSKFIFSVPCWDSVTVTGGRAAMHCAILSCISGVSLTSSLLFQGLRLLNAGG